MPGLLGEQCAFVFRSQPLAPLDAVAAVPSGSHPLLAIVCCWFRGEYREGLSRF
jgi:hypothetical protein